MNPVVIFETSEGCFEVELYADQAPLTVQNFLGYVGDQFYDGTLFHRVIDGFMIQGGGFDAKGGRKATKAAIRNESGNGARNVRYGVAMARTSDLDSATSQFFINVKDNDFLDKNQYCAFGLVINGREVVDRIRKVAVKKPGRLSEAEPVQPVVIQSARVKPPAA